MVDQTLQPSVFSPYSGNTGLSYAAPSQASAYYGVSPSSNSNSSGSGASSLTQYLPKDSSIFNPQSSTGSSIVSGVKSAVNNFGTGIGFAPGTVSYGTQFGPSLPGAAETAFGPGAVNAGTAVEGSLGTSATLSSVIGGAGFGVGIGGLLNKGNPVAGMIGGGLGGAIGAATGITSGIAMGAELGSIVPGLGTVIGAVAGGLASRMFGNKKPATSASEFAAQTGYNDNGGFADSGFGSVSYGAKNAGAYDGYNNKLASQLNDELQKAKGILGIDFSKGEVRGGVNTIHSPSGQPGYIMAAGQTFGFDPSKDDSRNAAIQQAVSAIAKTSGASDEAITGMLDKLNAPAGTSGTPMVAPAASQGPSQFQTFLENYKSTQNANAAPVSPPAV